MSNGTFGIQKQFIMHLLSVHLSFDALHFACKQNKTLSFFVVDFLFWITTNRRLSYNFASAFYYCDLKTLSQFTFRHIEHFTIKNHGNSFLKNCTQFYFRFNFWFFHTLFNCKIDDLYFSTEHPTKTSCPFIFIAIEFEFCKMKLLLNETALKSALVLY